MLNIALFGPPGAGKGTQSEFLIKKFNLTYISTGDILRQEIKEGSKLGKEASGIIKEGGLVPDEIIVQILEKKIRTTTDTKGFLFDGFPRTYVQAYILEGLLLRMHASLNLLISLEVPEKECVARLIERAKTSGRTDDTEEVIKKRLEEYRQKTLPVTNFYSEKGILEKVKGTGSIKEVSERVAEKVEQSLRKQLLNVVLLGYPGSGRGTQAEKLAEKYNLVYISTGDILAEELRKGSELGKMVQPRMEQGELIEDEVVIKLIEKQIHTHPDANGFIFKGFPRTIVQAYILDGLLLKIQSRVSLILDIEVPHLQLVKRLAKRGETPEAMPYDKSTETIVQRLEEHERKTLPVTEYYKRSKKIYSVDGSGSENEVLQRLTEHVDKAFRDVR
ncbi:MAG: adenylate kinase [bacterium]